MIVKCVQRELDHFLLETSCQQILFQQCGGWVDDRKKILCFHLLQRQAEGFKLCYLSHYYIIIAMCLCDNSQVRCINLQCNVLTFIKRDDDHYVGCLSIQRWELVAAYCRIYGKRMAL